MTDNWKNDLPSDSIAAAQFAIERFHEFDRPFIGKAINRDIYDEYIRQYVLVWYLAEKVIPGLKRPELKSDRNESLTEIRGFVVRVSNSCESVRLENLLSNTEKDVKAHFGDTIVYRFSTDEQKRIAVLIAELRELISESELLDDDHKRRLLARLEKLQAEVHKKISNLDVFWGVVGDAGVALGKLGNDAKPIVDRFREVIETAWKAQAKAEQLPPSDKIPLLTKTD